MGNPFEKIPDDRGKREEFPCPSCDGTGKIIVDKQKKDCNACGGTGKTNGH